MAAPLWITEADVARLLTLDDAVAALEHGLEAEAQSAAQNMVKTHATWGDGHTLHAIGAVFPSAGYAGTKTWAHTAGGAAPLLILFDSHDGSARAIIEAFTLGQLRTGGMSAVATRWLAAPEADELAIIGTGKQAFMQVAAVNAVRPLNRVRVFSPNPAHRRQFIERLQSQFAFEVVDAPTVTAAVEGAPIITAVTRATEPFLLVDMISRGTHINAIGAITPDRIEFAPNVLARCDAVVVDSCASVQKLSKEFNAYYGPGKRSWQDVRPLCEVVAQRCSRARAADLSLFKAMGVGIADLALGIEVYERARRADPAAASHR